MLFNLFFSIWEMALPPYSSLESLELMSGKFNSFSPFPLLQQTIYLLGRVLYESLWPPKGHSQPSLLSCKRVTLFPTSCTFPSPPIFFVYSTQSPSQIIVAFCVFNNTDYHLKKRRVAALTDPSAFPPPSDPPSLFIDIQHNSSLRMTSRAGSPRFLIDT